MADITFTAPPSLRTVASCPNCVHYIGGDDCRKHPRVVTTFDKDHVVWEGGSCPGIAMVCSSHEYPTQDGAHP